MGVVGPLWNGGLPFHPLGVALDGFLRFKCREQIRGIRHEDVHLAPHGDLPLIVIIGDQLVCARYGTTPDGPGAVLMRVRSRLKSVDVTVPLAFMSAAWHVADPVG